MQLRKEFFISATPATISLVTGTYKYTLPSDFYRFKNIRTTTSGQETTLWTAADPATPQFLYGLRSDVVITNPTNILYAVMGNNTLWVSPIPQGALTASGEYYTIPTAVANDTDTFVVPDTFLDFIEYGAASDLLAKGPVGDNQGWKALAENVWQQLILLIDTPRNDQSPDLVVGPYEEAI